MRSRWFAALISALGAASAPGCLPQGVSVPPGAQIACDDNTACPADFGCLEALGRCAPFSSGCLEPDEDFAVAVDDGTGCVEEGVAGVCRSGVCGAACGNGIVDASAGELCDFGAENRDDVPDRCRTDCLPARCGDGVVDSGETCDDDDDDCDDCFRVCLAGTVDDNGRRDDGCEAPLGVSFSAPRGSAQHLFAVGDELFYVDTDTRAIRAHDLVGGGDRLVVQRADFISGLVVVDDTIAWTEGTFATLFLAGPDGIAREQEDQVSAIVGGGGQLYVMGPQRLERRTLATGAVAALPGEPTFPPFIVSGDQAVVWASEDGLRLLRHDAPATASGVVVPDVFGATAATLEGEVLWFLDDALTLRRAAPGEAATVLGPMPQALAGHFPHAGLASSGPGRVATALTLDPESLEDGDEVAAVLVADLSGTWTMRARADDFFLSMVIADGRLWVSGRDGVYGVEP